MTHCSARPGKIAVIGGSSVVGLSVAARAAAGGADVVMIDQQETGLPVPHVFADPRRPEDAVTAVARATADFDERDGIVVCSGFGAASPRGLAALLACVGRGPAQLGPVIGTALAPEHHGARPEARVASERAVIDVVGGEGVRARTPYSCVVLHDPLAEPFLDCRGEPVEAPVEPGQVPPEAVATAVIKLFAPGYWVPTTQYVVAPGRRDVVQA